MPRLSALLLTLGLAAALPACKSASAAGDDSPAASDEPTEETYTSGDEDPPDDGIDDPM
ncbi:MAG: hypothetical protein AAGH15_25760 [Myxococcota bacterium]